MRTVTILFSFLLALLLIAVPADVRGQELNHRFNVSTGAVFLRRPPMRAAISIRAGTWIFAAA